MKEDSVGRPIYKRKEPTSQGKQVYLYHIHQTKKWRIGPAHEGAEAHNCWLFITSKGKIKVKKDPYTGHFSKFLGPFLTPFDPEMTVITEKAKIDLNDPSHISSKRNECLEGP